MIKSLYDKVCDGDQLLHVECTQGAEFFGQLADMLIKAGPAFAITAKEAMRTHDKLHGFAVARGLLPHRK